MSSVTANWFDNDEKYYNDTEDYALPCVSAKLIRRDIDEGNKFPTSGRFPGDTTNIHYFSDALQRYIGMVYPFVGPGTMVYADVDDANPNHAKEIKELQWQNREESEPGSEATKAALDALVAHFMDDKEFKKRWAHGLYDSNGERVEDPDSVQKAKARWIEQWLNAEVVYPKVLNAKVVNYLAGPGHDHSTELLNIISEQDHLKHKRPIMIVDHIIDSMQEPLSGVKRGWVTGYDIIKNEMIIKPFFSDKTRHPLGSSWSAETVNDGVSGRWTPIEFVQAYIQLAQQVKDQIADKTIVEVESKAGRATTDLQLPDKALGFRMYVHTIAGRTLFKLWRGLIEYHSSSPKEADTLKTTADQTYKTITAYLRRVPFPVVPQDKPTDAEEFVVPPFLRLAWELDEMENYYRRTAVDLKEHEEEKMAENTRQLYERIHGMVKAFNEDPKGVNVGEL